MPIPSQQDGNAAISSTVAEQGSAHRYTLMMAIDDDDLEDRECGGRLAEEDAASNGPPSSPSLFHHVPCPLWY
ncbi:hypothetical protein ColTof4_14084 [Colletotrichum tofieldiae]|nr:hypothetical protein ColTof3_03000 [Colletotrichum tofieldiae]GKT81661.1 hypothetical protein ColTof4_14084 [Colletotrichum tofieldiae]